MLRILMYWLCRVQLRVAQQTLVCRSWTERVLRWLLDGATFSSETTLNNGTNTIPFQARYFATGAATPVLLMRMRPSRFSINNNPGSGTSLRAGMPTLV